jgi:hypothetical protein
MRLPIDTQSVTLVAGKVEAVIDFETKRPKADANGEPVYSVDLVALGTEGAQIWPVKVAGEPKGIVVGQPVRVSELVAVPWSMDDRHGISFRAAQIGPLPAAAAKAA